MAEYLTNDTDLTSIADAIRTKGGTSAPLVYPQGFIDAIMALPVGGSSDYTVTISLTNPVHASAFHDCNIYAALSNDVYDLGENLGLISSAAGSTEVSVDSSVYGVVVVVAGMAVSTDLGMCSCTGDVSAEDTDGGGAILFRVTGNGTITIDGIDYDD